jgi:hypothetical protein
VIPVPMQDDADVTPAPIAGTSHALSPTRTSQAAPVIVSDDDSDIADDEPVDFEPATVNTDTCGICHSHDDPPTDKPGNRHQFSWVGCVKCPQTVASQHVQCRAWA